MAEENTRPGRIDRELIGEPISVGSRTIQPVARVSGWSGGKMGVTGGGAGGWVRVRPVEVIVREGDGSESRVPIPDAGAVAVALRSIASQALAVAGVCAAVIAGRALVGVLRPIKCDR